MSHAVVQYRQMHVCRAGWLLDRRVVLTPVVTMLAVSTCTFTGLFWDAGALHCALGGATEAGAVGDFTSLLM